MNILIMRGLQARARSEANFASDGVAELEAQHLAAVERERGIAKRLELTKQAGKRALAFKPRNATTYFCPCCAVYNDAAVELMEVAAADGHRHFICANCANEFDFEMRLRARA